MSIRTVTFESVLDGVALRSSRQLAAALPTGDLAALITYIADRVRTAWEFYRWPETMGLAAFNYLPTWLVGSTYTAGTQLWFLDATTGFSGYYQANASPNTPTAGQSPESAPQCWTLMANFHKSVAFANGTAPFTAVLTAWDSDPRAYDTAQTVPFTITNEGVTFDQDAPDTIWLDYRAAPPNFDAVPWDGTDAFAAGVTVYYSAGAGQGDCYLVLVTTTPGDTPVSAPTKFQLVPFPYILARAVKVGALADYFLASGSEDKAQKLEGSEGNGDVSTYFGLMEEQVRQLVTIQGQRGRWQFQPPPTVSTGPGFVNGSLVA